MLAQVVVDEAADEVVAVVVAGVAAQRQRLAGLGAGGLEALAIGEKPERIAIRAEAREEAFALTPPKDYPMAAARMVLDR